MKKEQVKPFFSVRFQIRECTEAANQDGLNWQANGDKKSKSLTYHCKAMAKKLENSEELRRLGRRTRSQSSPNEKARRTVRRAVSILSIEATQGLNWCQDRTKGGAYSGGRVAASKGSSSSKNRSQVQFGTDLNPLVK